MGEKATFHTGKKVLLLVAEPGCGPDSTGNMLGLPKLGTSQLLETSPNRALYCPTFHSPPQPRLANQLDAGWSWERRIGSGALSAVQ